MAIILEESECPCGDRIASIETKRKEEVVINVDKAVCALSDLFSELDNEIREGWVVNVSWYEDALRHLRASAYHTILF